MQDNFEKICHYDNNCIELNSAIRIIHNLVLKSFVVPFSQIAFIDADRIIVKSNDEGLDGKKIPYTGTIYEQSLLKGGVLIAQDLPITNLFENIGFYASAPLFTKTGHIMGCIIITDPKRRDFSIAESSLLEELALVISLIIEQHYEARNTRKVFADFIHKTVHDLKNPFTSIALTAELLKRKANDAAVVVKFSERIENANQKVFKNLEHLRSSFPLDNDTFKLAIVEIELDCLLEDIKNSFIRCAVTTENTLHEKIHADYDRLKEAILLLSHHMSLISDGGEGILINSYGKESVAIIALSVNNINNHTVAQVKSCAALSTANTLVEIQKGKIELVLNEELNRCGIYITLPLITS